MAVEMSLHEVLAPPLHEAPERGALQKRQGAGLTTSLILERHLSKVLLSHHFELVQSQAILVGPQAQEFIDHLQVHLAHRRH